MRLRTIFWIAVIDFVVTIIWLALLISGMMVAGPLDTFQQVLDYTIQLDPILHYLTFVNAAILTFVTVLFLIGLYTMTKEYDEGLSIICLVFTGMYGILNLVAYFSQVTVVPLLVDLHLTLGDPVLTETLLRLTILLWDQSVTVFLNQLAYFMLAVPSIIYGYLFLRKWYSLRMLQIAGVLLISSGVLSIGSLAMMIVAPGLPVPLSLISGAVFLFSFIPMLIEFYSMSKEERE